MGALIRADEAVALMRKTGFEPLEPYPGMADRRWRVRCRMCGNDLVRKLSRRSAPCGHRGTPYFHISGARAGGQA